MSPSHIILLRNGLCPLCGQATLSQTLVPAATWIFTDEIPSACWWPRGKGVNQLGGRCGSCWYNKEERDAALRPAGNEERGEGRIEHVELRTNVSPDRFCSFFATALDQSHVTLQDLPSVQSSRIGFCFKFIVIWTPSCRRLFTYVCYIMMKNCRYFKTVVTSQSESAWSHFKA